MDKDNHIIDSEDDNCLHTRVTVMKSEADNYIVENFGRVLICNYSASMSSSDIDVKLNGLDFCPKVGTEFEIILRPVRKNTGKEK